MSAVFCLIRFFFKDLLYKRIFVVSVFIGICFIVLSLLLGPLSFKEESRLAVNFSLAGSQIALILLSILIGADFLRSDVDQKILHSFLTRPISRTQYYLSKVLAFGLSLLVMVFLMWTAFVAVALFTKVEGLGRSFVPFIGVYFEAYLLFGCALLFSLFSSSLLAIGLSFSIFLAGHWVDTFVFLSEKSDVFFVKSFGYVFSKLIPNLESLNWKAHLTYNEWKTFYEYFSFSLYGFFWLSAVVLIGCLVFNQKDLS